MKQYLFSLIIFATVFSVATNNTYAETFYKAEDFLAKVSLGEIQKTETSNKTTDGGQTLTTTYKDGSTMTVMPNSPNPPIITWRLSNGAIYQTKPGTTDQYIQTQAETPPPTQTPQTRQTPLDQVQMPTESTVLNSIVPKEYFEDKPLNRLLNQLFYIGLVGAVILAIVMIIRGGVEYMTIDAIASKENGKRRVQAAMGGLLLAFSAILILNTINPGLTKLNIKFDQIKQISSLMVGGLTSGTRVGTDANGNPIYVPSTPSGEGEANPSVTAYSPQGGGDKMEGGYESSKAGLDGKYLVRTLDDYASGNSPYITLAGDPSLYGKSYIIPQLTYINSNGQTITLNNVKGYVHDTGSAFTGQGSSRFDIPVGKDYSSEALNSQPFSKKNIKFIPAK